MTIWGYMILGLNQSIKIMLIFFIIVLILLGFILGSFLNVVSLRFNTGKSINGRSMCFSCGKKLKWYELIPVVSWLVQNGRCRSCSSNISVELLMSELVTGLFFGLIAIRGIFAFSFILDNSYFISTIYLLIIFSILIVILFYDLRHKIIPDSLSVAFAVITFVGMFFFAFKGGLFTFVGFNIPGIFNILGGIIIPIPFVLIWLLSKGKQMGLGDSKLMVGIGFLVGTSLGFSAIFISFWVATLFVIFLFIFNKIMNKKLVLAGENSIMKTEIPFAPFLIIGVLITIIFGINVLFL